MPRTTRMFTRILKYHLHLKDQALVDMKMTLEPFWNCRSQDARSRDRTLTRIFGKTPQVQFYGKRNYTGIPRRLHEPLTFTCQMVNTWGVQAIALHAFQSMSSPQPYEIKPSHCTVAAMKEEKGHLPSPSS